MTIKYQLPTVWIRYDRERVLLALVDAKAAVLSLQTVPHQRSWVQALQDLELKREVAGTSRIEGAEFTDRELDVAIRDFVTTIQRIAETSTRALAEPLTRSQRQARGAVQTYRWLSAVPEDRPVDGQLIREIHRRMVTGADDDHCPPGEIRQRDQNVLFGAPRHRGVEGGEECDAAVAALSSAIQREFREHDPLVQALAAHYHVAAMHPFLDGNGRTARALEALLLQRAGLRNTCFIAMSNYYYEEKTDYLATLAAVRAGDHDLTPFLTFALKGVSQQSRRLLAEIQRHLARTLYRELMYDLFGRLRTPRKRVIAQRQIEILKVLLESETTDFEVLQGKVEPSYRSLKSPRKILERDVNALIALGAIDFELQEDRAPPRLWVRLEWPTEITETEFFARVQAFPKAKTHSFLR